MTQYFFALVNPEAQQLFKYEMKLKYPDLKLAYSRSGFFTFKGNCAKKFDPVFARVAGLSLGKTSINELKTPYWAWTRSPELGLDNDLITISDNTWFKVGETVRLLMKIDTDEYWLGEYILEDHHLQTPGEISFLGEINCPSRAYYKIAEATESLNLDFGQGTRVLELGSAPGGASQFLLEQGCEVIGVDPAMMDEGVLRNPKFKHIQKPFESLGPHYFREPVDWIVSDINLPPTVVVKEVIRLLTFLRPQGLLLTLKINQDKHLHNLQNIIQSIEKTGLKTVIKYLPSHRKEVVLKAFR
ncbi:MAG TPA: SAM-dependent methyltransferase [Bacteriovoracaceae bacterium]|nr:SAM-dependent methyltransferase [Bacteriovoracaceae bacterium]